MRGWRALGRLRNDAALSRSSEVKGHAAIPLRPATRSIYTNSGTQPFGFGHNVGGQSQEQQHSIRQPWQPSNLRASGGSHTAGNTGFLPVPFVTEQIAGAHHSTDLFSRLLKERIVAVYGQL